MPLSKSRLVAAGLLAAGLGAAVAFGDIIPQWHGALPSGVASAVGETAAAAPQVADKQEGAKEPEGGGVRVETPHAEVNVDREHGQVSVKAPYTDVRVDPDKGRVQVRAPYVNLDIRW